MPKPTIQQWPDLLRNIVNEVAQNSKCTPKEALNKLGLNKFMTLNSQLRKRGYDEVTGQDWAATKDFRTVLANEYDKPRPKAPKKNPYANPVEYSFQYWFNYFYRDVPTDKQQSFFDQITDMDGRRLPVAKLDWKKLLTEMCKEGFDEYTTDERMHADVLYKDAVRTNHGGLQSQGVSVVFRGDGRTPAMIQQNNGTKPQLQVPYLAQKTNMEQPWHPFSGATVKKVYFRKGHNRDNCLFSAISVTPEFYVATKFPMIDMLAHTSPDKVGVADVIVAQHKRDGKMLPKVEVLPRVLKASKTMIYIIKTNGGWNTQVKQLAQGDATFPEYCYDNISWEDHLACIPVIRLHYSDNPNHGHQIVVEPWQWLQPLPVLERLLLGPNATATLREFLINLYKRGSVQAGGIPCYPDPTFKPDFEIKRIVRPFTMGTHAFKPPAAVASPVGKVKMPGWMAGMRTA